MLRAHILSGRRLAANASLLLVVFGAAAASVGCRDEKKAAPAADADAGAPAPSAAVAQPRMPPAKISPHVMKAYRADVCYVGTQSLLVAKDAYMQSLGDAEPSADKLPWFGDQRAEESEAPAAEEKPATPTKPENPRDEARRKAIEARQKRGTRVPHERNARSCTVAAGLRAPAAPELDPALNDFAPYAVKLAKLITAASVYYEREQYKQDNFEKGKELHKQLLAEFAELEAKHAGLGKAIAAWRTASPPPENPVVSEGEPPPEPTDQKEIDRQKVEEEGRKIGDATYADARELIWLMLEKEPDTEMLAALIGKANAQAAKLSAFGRENVEDTWSKILVGPVEKFTEELAKAKDDGKLADLDTRRELGVLATRVVEARHRAVTRALIARRHGAGGLPFGEARMGPRLPHKLPTPAKPAAPTDAPAPEGESGE